VPELAGGMGGVRELPGAGEQRRDSGRIRREWMR